MQKRAVQPEDKELRRQAILLAVRDLWVAHPDRVPSVAEVAAAAGVAKGTLYLYFNSKEELLLALFERLLDAFFDALVARCQAGPTDLPDLLELTRAHLIDAPGFLPLASMVLGLAERQLPPAVVADSNIRSARRLERAALALLEHLPLGGPHAAAELLNASYALILGLWHLRQKTQNLPELQREPALAAVTGDYFTVLSRALTALWRGYMASPQPASAARP